MQTSQDRSKLKQRRTITYFVEAAREIVEQEGIAAVTIRRAAHLAGYASATLYNYFDSLPHLVFLATMSCLDDYHAALSGYLEGCDNSLEGHVAVCKCFSEFAFAHPEVYELIFFTLSREKIEEYTYQYYDLFPGKVAREWSAPFNKLLNINNMSACNRDMLTCCVEEGFFTDERAADYLDVSLRLFKSILQDVRSGNLNKDTAVALIMKYFFQLMSRYVLPEKQGLLARARKRWDQPSAAG